MISKLKAALLLLLLPVLSHASAITTGTSQSIDWLTVLRAQVDALTTSTGGVLLDVGWIEADAAIVIGLVSICIRWHYGMLDLHHHQHLHISEVVIFLWQSVMVASVLQYYQTPIPGLGVNAHQILPALGQAVEHSIHLAMLNDLYAGIRSVTENMEHPGPANLLGILIYLSVYIDMAAIELALFVIGAAGSLFLGILTLFGPLFIPMFLTKHFNAMFWRWFESMLSFSMYGAVSAGVTFVFGGIFTTFFTRAVHSDYSIANFIILLPVLVMLTAAFAVVIFQIPTFVGRLFGGLGDMGQGFASAVQAGVVALAA